MARVVVVGSSFAGLTAALELKAKLSEQDEVVVISDHDEFLFAPSLIWVPFGLRRREQISFALRPALESHGVRFLQREVLGIDRRANELVTQNGRLPYDALVLATGLRPEWTAVPGLGPRGGFSQSIFSFEDAQLAQVAWERFLLNPGPVVIGAARGATSLAPAYEFALNVAYQLEKRGPAGYAQQTFVTPEPYAGHLGLDGLGAASEKIDRLMKEHGIETVTNASIAAVESDRVVLADGRALPFSFAMIAPPMRGVPMLAESGFSVDDEGLLRVDDALRVDGEEAVFAAGATVRLPMEEGPNGRRFAKTGYHSERLGKHVAANVAAVLSGKALDLLEAKDLDSKYILDAGDTGLVMSSSSRERDADEWVLPGFEAHWAKVALERFYMATRSRGVVP